MIFAFKVNVNKAYCVVVVTAQSIWRRTNSPRLGMFIQYLIRAKTSLSHCLISSLPSLLSMSVCLISDRSAPSFIDWREMSFWTTNGNQVVSCA